MKNMFPYSKWNLRSQRTRRLEWPWVAMWSFRSMISLWISFTTFRLSLASSGVSASNHILFLEGISDGYIKRIINYTRDCKWPECQGHKKAPGSKVEKWGKKNYQQIFLILDIQFNQVSNSFTFRTLKRGWQYFNS